MDTVSFHEHQVVVAGLNTQQHLLTQRSADHRARVEELEKRIEALVEKADVADNALTQLAIAGRMADRTTPLSTLDSTYCRESLSPSAKAVRDMRGDLELANGAGKILSDALNAERETSANLRVKFIALEEKLKRKRRITKR